MPHRPTRSFARSSASLALALTALVAAACGSDDAPTTNPDGLCPVYEAACRRQAECQVPVVTNVQQEADCLAQLDCGPNSAALTAAGIAIDGDDVRACAAAIEAATCDQLRPWRGGNPAQFFDTVAACSTMMAGTKPAGGSCTSSAQCADGLTCAGDTCPGVCGADPTSCTRDSCGAGQFCDFDGCRPRAARGAACEYSDGFFNTCVDGLYCKIDGGPTGVCVDPTPAGGACTDASYFVCADGNACIDNLCAPIKPLGASCTTATECGLDRFCDFGHGNVCAVPRALGAACDDAWAACGLHADCVDDRCQPLGTEPTPMPEPVTYRPTVAAGGDCAMANCGAGLACLPHMTASGVAWQCDPVAHPGQACGGAPDVRFAVLFSNRYLTACVDSICNVFAPDWTCVVPQPVGGACTANGSSLECVSGLCDRGRCADLFTCPAAR